MTGREVVINRFSEIAKDVQQYFLQRVALVFDLDTIFHFAKNKRGYFVEFPEQFEMGEHAIDLIGLGCHIFKKEN